MFGNESYSKDELTVDVVVTFLRGHAGILPDTIDNIAACIQNKSIINYSCILSR